jgi:hypothetical protein
LHTPYKKFIEIYCNGKTHYQQSLKEILNEGLTQLFPIDLLQQPMAKTT